MIDSAIIFFAAILGVMAICHALTQSRNAFRRLKNTWPSAFRWTKNTRLQKAGGILAIVAPWVPVAAAAVLLAGLVWIATWGREDLARLTWPGMWWRWIFDGTGALLLAGLIAGGILVRMLRDRPEAPRYGGPSDFWRNLSAAIGPALLIAALFLLASPGLLRRLGLNEVRVGEVAFNFAASPELPSTTQNPIFLPPGNGLGGAKDDFLKALMDIAGLEPQGRNSLFGRDGATFLKVAGRDPFNTAMPGDPDLSPATRQLFQAMRQQQDLLHSLQPTLRCVKSYAERFPFRPGTDPYLGAVLKPLVDQLADLEPALRARNIGTNSQYSAASLDTSRNAVQESLGTVYQALYKQLQDPNACPTPVALPPLTVPQRNVPYLAIFVAYAYAYIGGGDRGLDILANWMTADDNNIHNNMYSADPGTRVLYARVATEFGAIQVGPATFPLSYSYRLTLDWELNMIRRVMHTDPDAWMRSHEHQRCPVSPSDYNLVEEGMLKAYLNTAALDLQAAVDSIAPEQRLGIGVTPNEVALAKTLIRFDPSTVCSWSPARQEQWRAVLRLEGGRTLARWLLEGQREGLLGSSEAQALSDQVRRALARAARLFAKVEAEDTRTREVTNSGPIVAVSWLEPYLVEAEQELIASQRPSD